MAKKSRSDKGKKRGPKVMKKVTKRQAYRSNVKKQMMLRRAPLVETKQRTHSDIAEINGHALLEKVGTDPENYDYLTLGDLEQPLNWRIIPNDDAFYHIPLNSFLRQHQGLKPYQMIGDSTTVKYINTRLEFRFPQGEIFKLHPSSPTQTYRNMFIQQNVKVYVIFGWVTNPTNAPIADPTTERIRLDEFTQINLENHIKSEIAPYFNEDTDKLSFRPRETMNIKIEKYVRLKPNLMGSLSTQAVPTYNSGVAATTYTSAQGAIPNVMRSHSFNVNRKILYSEGKEVDPPYGYKDYENNFPNNSWLPFCCVYTPAWANMKSVSYQTDNTTNPVSRSSFDAVHERRTQNIFVRWNDQTVYTDS